MGTSPVASSGTLEYIWRVRRKFLLEFYFKFDYRMSYGAKMPFVIVYVYTLQIYYRVPVLAYNQFIYPKMIIKIEKKIHMNLM